MAHKRKAAAGVVQLGRRHTQVHQDTIRPPPPYTAQCLVEMLEGTVEPREPGIIRCQLPGYANCLGIFINTLQLAGLAQLPENQTAVATSAKSCIHIATGRIVDQVIHGLVEQYRTVFEGCCGFLLVIRHSDNASISGGMSSSPDDSSSQANQRSSLQSSSFLP